MVARDQADRGGLAASDAARTNRQIETVFGVKLDGPSRVFGAIISGLWFGIGHKR
jgi:hypothetical protein